MSWSTFSKQGFETSCSNPVSEKLAEACFQSILKAVGSHLDPSSTKVLDYASGPGLVSRKLAPKVREIVGADVSSETLKEFNVQVSVCSRLNAAHD